MKRTLVKSAKAENQTNGNDVSPASTPLGGSSSSCLSSSHDHDGGYQGSGGGNQSMTPNLVGVPPSFQHEQLVQSLSLAALCNGNNATSTTLLGAALLHHTCLEDLVDPVSQHFL